MGHLVYHCRNKNKQKAHYISNGQNSKIDDISENLRNLYKCTVSKMKMRV